MIDKQTENNEHQPLTSGIKHWGLSGYASVLPRIKFGVTGQDSSPQSPTISYRRPLCVSLKTPPRRKYYLDKIELIYEGWNFSGTTFSISIKQSFH